MSTVGDRAVTNQSFDTLLAVVQTALYILLTLCAAGLFGWLTAAE